MDNFSFLNDLNSKQQEICQSPRNYILTACPGSGKTRTITYRLAYLQQKYSSSRKYNIAITYTNRAAEEIESRLDDLGIDTSCIWTGTIHQFCMHFIIRPYAMYSDRLRKGYRIIDEYVSAEYGRTIANQLGLSYGYDDPLSFPEVCQRYNQLLVEKKEIDFDQILSLSHDLVKSNSYICENIASIIRSIHVDEYQDTKELQYQILAEIIKANTAINLLFVGDVNQAIYGTLGSVAKSADEIRELYPLEFCEETLNGCYRSTQRLVDYYRQFEINTTNAWAVSDIRDNRGVISYSQSVSFVNLAQSIADIISSQLQQGIPESEICVTAPQWYLIFPISKKLQELLPTVHFDSPNITPFKYDRMNPFYLLAQLTYTKSGAKVSSRRRIAGELIDILRNDYEVAISDQVDAYSILKVVNSSIIPNSDGLTCLNNVISQVFRFLKITSLQETALAATCKSFFDKAQYRIKKYDLPCTYDDLVNSFKEKEGVVISTIHGTKGEEYQTVIAYGLLRGFLPNWNLIHAQPITAQSEAKKLLYVLCSRAKSNLYLFSETGRYTSSRNAYTPSVELLAARCDYD